MVKYPKFNKTFSLRLIKHPLFITVTAGFITCFIGYKIAHQYQIRQLRYQQEFEIFKEHFYGGMSLLEDISLSASERVMGMQRVIWVIKGTSYGDLQAAWNDYYKTVLNWNIKQLVYKTKLMQYVGDQALIDSLMNNEDSQASLYEDKTPQSLHGRFLRSHLIVKKLYQCARNNCSKNDRNILIKNAEKETFDTTFAIEEFHKKFIKEIYEVVGKNRENIFYQRDRNESLGN